jgi:hypothetical protein
MSDTNTTTSTRLIDMTPTWEGLLPLYLAAYSNGSFKGMKAAEKELTRMAKLADIGAQILQEQHKATEQVGNNTYFVWRFVDRMPLVTSDRGVVRSMADRMGRWDISKDERKRFYRVALERHHQNRKLFNVLSEHFHMPNR